MTGLNSKGSHEKLAIQIPVLQNTYGFVRTWLFRRGRQRNEQRFSLEFPLSERNTFLPVHGAQRPSVNTALDSNASMS